MREILFRGKSPVSGEWAYGSLILETNAFDEKLVLAIISDADGNETLVNSETVGQYTGLCDRNGTRIFENDIISAHPDELFPDDEIRLVVEWHDYGWFGKDSKGRYTSLESKWVSELFKVIGNRFDNPVWDGFYSKIKAEHERRKGDGTNG